MQNGGSAQTGFVLSDSIADSFGVNEDQSHHAAAFIILGYQLQSVYGQMAGEMLSTVAAYLQEANNAFSNVNDINLGMQSALLGMQFARDLMDPYSRGRAGLNLAIGISTLCR